MFTEKSSCLCTQSVSLFFSTPPVRSRIAFHIRARSESLPYNRSPTRSSPDRYNLRAPRQQSAHSRVNKQTRTSRHLRYNHNHNLLLSSVAAGKRTGSWTRIDRLQIPRLRYRDFRISKRHRTRNGLMTSRRQPWEDMKCGASERGADCN